MPTYDEVIIDSWLSIVTVIMSDSRQYFS
uniref:Uncharacterized protein n=1 Tax=Rhizophora mucronata TaxID=61149 RepID=A0A2P2QG35_RHIMU